MLLPARQIAAALRNLRKINFLRNKALVGKASLEWTSLPGNWQNPLEQHDLQFPHILYRSEPLWVRLPWNSMTSKFTHFLQRAAPIGNSALEWTKPLWNRQALLE